MTRYFCDDVSHWRDGEPRIVDVTAQVRLELGYIADREAYGADVHEVIGRIMQLSTDDRTDRRAEIRQILTGTRSPTGAPVRLVDGRAGAPNQVVRLPEAGAPRGDLGTVSTRAELRTVPGASLTGTYAADELAARLASADPTPESLADAVRRSPTFESRTADRVGRPWRVVIMCPVPEGDPPSAHRVVFAGSGEPEQLDVFGIPASSWDLALEASASTDLTPSHGTRRAERLLGWLLLAEVAIALAVAGATWATGGLGMAAREAPGWLLLAVILGVAAMAFATIGLFGPRAPQGNVNDTLIVSGFYASRTEMLWIAAAISIALFATSLAVAFAGPLSSDDGAIPTPAVSFEIQGTRTTAVIDLVGSGIGIDERPTVTLRAFFGRTDVGITIGTVVATGTTDGQVVVHDVVGVPSGADFLAVLVNVGGHGPTSCNPIAATDAGCTVLSVPQPSPRSGTATASGPAVGIVTASSPSPTVAPSTTVAPPTTVAPSTTTVPTTSVVPSTTAPVVAP